MSTEQLAIDWQALRSAFGDEDEFGMERANYLDRGDSGTVRFVPSTPGPIGREMIGRLLRHWASASPRKKISRLQSELDCERVKNKVAQAEIESLAALVARDRKRVQAEGAAYARQRAESESVTSDRLTEQSARRFTA